ncbi:MAG: hypothetical protein AB1397_07565, partial [bacterium]
LLIQNSTFKIHNFIKFSLRLSKHIHFVKRYGINYKCSLKESFGVAIRVIAEDIIKGFVGGVMPISPKISSSLNRRKNSSK